MDNYHMQFPKKRIWLVSLTVFLVLSLLLIFITQTVNNRWYQREVIDATDNYIVLQYEVMNLMETGSTLLEGYEAYLKVNGSLTNDASEAYLNHLTKEEMIYIRNIGVIKDTTIIYNYPMEGNESSIGVDLAKVEGQKEDVLRIKETLEGFVVGPVDLVQGGLGYIIRKPLEDARGNYWGQISIVLRADMIVAAIDAYKEALGVDIAIYEDQTNEKLIYGDPSILDQGPLAFDFNSDLSQWVVYVVPENGWEKYTGSMVSMLSVGFALIIGVVASLYYVQTINYDLQKALAHDQLTGLYSRHYLEKVQKEITFKAKLNKASFGLMHIDLNSFKSINDIYGHEAGDRVLVETARVLGMVTRKNELVFRVGGDEFLVMMPKVADMKELKAFKDRLKQEFLENYSLTDYQVDIGPSIGVGIYPEDGDDFDMVLRHADERMYEEKGANRR